MTAISSSALHSALCVLPYRSFVLEHNKQWIKTVKGRDRGQEIFKVFLVYVKLSIPDIIPYNNFNIQTTAVVNLYTPVFVENENRYGSSVRRKNDSILKFWCFFYPFDYGNFIRYLINNKTNGYMRNLIFFLNVALGK